ncbi:MAG: hypothetical protein IPF55_04310 [Rhodoferax sp.]|nr:hypothetical protein [Rhodoferax sp.]
MLARPTSLAQQNALLLGLVFIVFELLAAAAVAAFVMVPMARRSTDDLANLMVLSAQTWSELPRPPGRISSGNWIGPTCSPCETELANAVATSGMAPTCTFWNLP